MPAQLSGHGIPLSRLLTAGVAAGSDPLITGLTLDSRDVQPGYLFCAVPGARHDGRDFISEVVKAGCGAIVAEQRNLERFPGEGLPVPLIPVAELARELSGIAGRFYGDPSRAMNVMGVTGTNGKTTCSMLLAQLFAGLGRRSAIVGTLGFGPAAVDQESLSATGMTTPDALRTQRILADFRAEGMEMVAMEVSSHSLDQHRVAAVAFDLAIFTNLSRDHLDYHPDLNAYGAAKAALFHMRGLKTAVINVDDPFGRQLFDTLPAAVTGISYSVHGRADLWVDAIQFHHQGIDARIHSPWGEGMLHSRLLGEFNLSNLLAVVAAACASGLPLDKTLEVLAVLKPVPGRMEVVDSGAAPQVVVDYAHTPDALEKALSALRQHCDGQLWCVFGCGGDRDPGKRPQMGAIAARLADQVVVTSDNPRSEEPAGIVAGVLAGIDTREAVRVELDRRGAIRFAIGSAGPADTVLIAGKGHEDYQQVGAERLPFSDVVEARLALRERLAAKPGEGL